MLKISYNYHRAKVFFFTRCVIGIDGLGFCRSFVSSSATFITASDEEIIDSCVCSGKSSIVSESSSEAFLGM